MNRPAEQSSSQQTARGAATVLTSQELTLGGQFLGDIVLARILNPEDFGVVAMSLAITGLALQFKDFGLSAAAIQAPDLTEQQASNLFWCNLGLSLLLTGIVMLAAPLAGVFYSNSQLSQITLALSGSILLSGIGIQHQAQLTRQLRFADVAKGQLAGLLAGYLLATVAALFGAAHWSLVTLQLARAAVTSAAFWLATQWVPRAPDKLVETWSLIRLGGLVAAFDVVNYASRNGDKLIVGRLYGEAILGHYNRAYQLLLLPIAQVRGPLVSAGMPILSRLHRAPDDFRRLFAGMVEVVATLAIPLIAWMGLYSDQLIPLLFGEKWRASIEHFQILAIAGLPQPTVGMLGLALVSLGLGRRYFVWGCWHAALMVSSFIIGSKWGLTGMITGYAIGNWLAAVPSFWFCTRGTPLNTRDLASAHLMPAAFTAAAALSSWAYSRVMDGNGKLELLTGTIIFGLVYVSQGLFIRKRRERLYRVCVAIRAKRPI